LVEEWTNDKQAEYKMTVLNRFKLMSVQYLTEGLREHAIDCAIKGEIAEHTRYHLDETVLQFTAMIYGTDRQALDVTYPANWWEAVKDRFMPQFLRKKFPIRYIHHEVIARQMFPTVRPHNDHPITYTLLEYKDVDTWTAEE